MTDKALSIGGLETVYDALASAIDQAGADKAQLFQAQIQVALQDL